MTTLEQGIPPVPLPDTSMGRVPVPRNTLIRSPNPGDVDRAFADEVSSQTVLRDWKLAKAWLLRETKRGGGPPLRAGAHGVTPAGGRGVSSSSA